jgi:hypothetical protein
MMTEMIHLFQPDSPTSEEAARSVDLDSGERVYRCIAAGGVNGAIGEEVSFALGMRHQSSTARIVDLLGAGRIVRTNRVRPTTTGRRAFVYLDADLLEPGSRLLMTGR